MDYLTPRWLIRLRRSHSSSSSCPISVGELAQSVQQMRRQLTTLFCKSLWWASNGYRAVMSNGLGLIPQQHHHPRCIPSSWCFCLPTRNPSHHSGPPLVPTASPLATEMKVAKANNERVPRLSAEPHPCFSACCCPRVGERGKPKSEPQNAVSRDANRCERFASLTHCFSLFTDRRLMLTMHV